MSLAHVALSVEAEAFIENVRTLSPDQRTAAEDWDVHQLVAHCAAGPAERARVIEANLAGETDPPTRGFDEREAPYRSMAYCDLLDALEHHLRRFTDVNQQLASTSAPWVTFTGWRLTSTELAVHGRSELAVHLWDAVGRTPQTDRLLAQRELTEHAVKVLTALPQLAEAPAQRSSRAGLDDVLATLRLAATGSSIDVLVHLAGQQTHLEVVDADQDQPAITSSPAARLLTIWGRRPTHSEPPVNTLEHADAGFLTKWLYA